ncbi:MAG: hypothetical protein AB7N76_03935 [Planctomycetota bacterium]
MDPSETVPPPAPPAGGLTAQQKFAALPQAQKIGIAVGATILALVLVVLLATPPRLITLKEYKDLRGKRSGSSWILEGKVHSSGETLGAGMPGAPREQMSIGGVRLHYLRLEDASGDRAVVWVNRADTPVPAKDTPVRVTGRFRSVPLNMGGKKMGDKTIGVVSKIGPPAQK